jgi:hypothetical protein
MVTQGSVESVRGAESRHKAVTVDRENVKDWTDSLRHLDKITNFISRACKWNPRLRRF